LQKEKKRETERKRRPGPASLYPGWVSCSYLNEGLGFLAGHGGKVGFEGGRKKEGKRRKKRKEKKVKRLEKRSQNFSFFPPSRLTSFFVD
jgi:hypothetical protein